MDESQIPDFRRHVTEYLDVEPVLIETECPGVGEITSALREPWANYRLENREIGRYLEFLGEFPGRKESFNSQALLDMRDSTGAVDKSVRGYSFSKFFDVLALTTLVGGLTSGIFGAIYGNPIMEIIAVSNFVAVPAFLGISDKFDWNLEIIEAWRDAMVRARTKRDLLRRCDVADKELVRALPSLSA